MGLKHSLSPLTRRRFIFVSAALTIWSCVSPWSPIWATEQKNLRQLFMTVSRLITSAELSLQTGVQLYFALQQSNPTFDTHLQEFGKIITATPNITIESLGDLLKKNQQQDLLVTMNSIIAAWYTGIVGHRTYAYQTALMYRPTRDVLSPPSYTRGGPLNWANSLPSIDF